MHKDEVKVKVSEFVESGEKTLSFDELIPVSHIEEAMLAIGFSFEMDGGETNGWEVDFWYKFTSELYGNYTYQGSLFYGKPMLRKD